MGRDAGGAKLVNLVPSKKKEGRKKRLVEKVRVVDATTRQHIQSQWLSSLEDDNHGGPSADAAADDDDDYNPLLDEGNDDGDLVADTPTTKKRARANPPKRKGRAAAPQSKTTIKGIARYNKTLADILRDDVPSDYPEGYPTYESLNAKPSTRPPRPLCSVCGYTSPYTCVRCGARFCSLKCMKIHEETRCLKWTV